MSGFLIVVGILLLPQSIAYFLLTGQESIYGLIFFFYFDQHHLFPTWYLSSHLCGHFQSMVPCDC
jgi:hypothetical protein